MCPKYVSRPNPELYEINTAAWLFELSQKLGKPVRLGDVPSGEWDRVKSWGMDFVWLMGVWERSRTGRNISLNDPGFHRLFDKITPGWTRQDILGSAYSIRSYDPDPLIGRWEDIDRARSELNARGVGLVLDFIPNHTGTDHHWLHEHPEYYIQSSREDYLKDSSAFFPVNYRSQTLYVAHGRDPNFPPWTDTAQLNYFNPATREAMVDIIEKIANHCDGIRCDMAMLLLNEAFQRVWCKFNNPAESEVLEEEFWGVVTHRIPNLVYIAEVYWDTEWTFQQLGFDYTYDKRFYDRLKNGCPHDVYTHLLADMDYQKKMVRFIENHDEPRSAATFIRGKIKTAAVLYSTLPGMKLYFQGQLEGRRIRLPVQIRRGQPEPVDPEIKRLYERLLPVINRDIFHLGQWKLKPVFPHSNNTAENILAYTWKLDDQFLLIVGNLSPQSSQGRICIQDDLDESLNYLFTDELSGQQFSESGLLIAHPGIILDMEEYEARLFSLSPEYYGNAIK